MDTKVEEITTLKRQVADHQKEIDQLYGIAAHLEQALRQVAAEAFDSYKTTNPTKEK